MLHRALEQLNAANAIMRFCSDYFRDKYGLTPDNQITPHGEIIDAKQNGLSLFDTTRAPN